MRFTNTLTLLPSRVRFWLYVAYGLVSLAVSATQVGVASLGYAQPAWLTVAVAVVAFLAVPFSSLASNNVSTSKTDEPQP